jgi:hypothetical protein
MGTRLWLLLVLLLLRSPRYPLLTPRYSLRESGTHELRNGILDTESTEAEESTEKRLTVLPYGRISDREHKERRGSASLPSSDFCLLNSNSYLLLLRPPVS